MTSWTSARPVVTARACVTVTQQACVGFWCSGSLNPRRDRCLARTFACMLLCAGTRQMARAHGLSNNACAGWRQWWRTKRNRHTGEWVGVRGRQMRARLKVCCITHTHTILRGEVAERAPPTHMLLHWRCRGAHAQGRLTLNHTTLTTPTGMRCVHARASAVEHLPRAGVGGCESAECRKRSLVICADVLIKSSCALVVGPKHDHHLTI
jgi:hypothetical protein